MTTLAEILGIYRDIMRHTSRTLLEDIQPAKPLSPSDPTIAAYNDAQRIAGNSTGQTSKALQDLSAAKEEVPVDPSERSAADNAKLAKAKAEVAGLPLDGVTAESTRSAIFKALMQEALDEPERDYQDHVLSSLHGWFKRNVPNARKMIWLTSSQSAEAGDRLYRTILLPRIVKWDFPHHFSLEYQDMIRDLLKTIEQHQP